jgi:hypothetical protein
MRIFVGAACGLAIGVLMLIDFIGVEWCPRAMVSVLDFPAQLLIPLIFGRQPSWLAIAFTVFVQWLLIGAIVGFIWHLVHKMKRSS